MVVKPQQFCKDIVKKLNYAILVLDNVPDDDMYDTDSNTVKYNKLNFLTEADLCPPIITILENSLRNYNNKHIVDYSKTILIQLIEAIPNRETFDVKNILSKFEYLHAEGTYTLFKQREIIHNNYNLRDELFELYSKLLNNSKQLNGGGKSNKRANKSKNVNRKHTKKVNRKRTKTKKSKKVKNKSKMCQNK